MKISSFFLQEWHIFEVWDTIGCRSMDWIKPRCIKDTRYALICNVCSKSFLDFVCCPAIFLIESYPLHETLMQKNWVKFCTIDHFITYIKWTSYWKRTQNISISGRKGGTIVRYYIIRENLVLKKMLIFWGDLFGKLRNMFDQQHNPAPLTRAPLQLIHSVNNDDDNDDDYLE